MKSPRTLIKENYTKSLSMQAKCSTHPCSPKGTDTIFECFDDQTVRKIIETDPLHQVFKRKTPEIRVSDEQKANNVVAAQNNKVNIRPSLKQKKKGSMHMSELWSTKQVHSVLRTPKHERLYREILQAKLPSVDDRIEKVRRKYDKRKSNLNLLDPTKVIEQFLAKDFEKSPTKTQRYSPSKSDIGESLNFLSFNFKELEEVQEDQDDIFLKARQFPAIPKNISNLLTKIHDVGGSDNSGTCQSSRGTTRIMRSLSPDFKMMKSMPSIDPRSLKSLTFLNDQDLNKQNTESPREKANFSAKKVKLTVLPLVKLGEQPQTPRQIAKSFSSLCQHSTARTFGQNEISSPRTLNIKTKKCKTQLIHDK